MCVFVSRVFLKSFCILFSHHKVDLLLFKQWLLKARSSTEACEKKRHLCLVPEKNTISPDYGTVKLTKIVLGVTCLNYASTSNTMHM